MGCDAPVGIVQTESQKGFSLIEVIVAMLVLLILITGMVVIQEYVASRTFNNQVKLAATKLASNYLEVIKASDYHDIGWNNGSPQGKFAIQTDADNNPLMNTVIDASGVAHQYYTYENFPSVTSLNSNVTYWPIITINWQVDPSVLSSSVSAFPADYKMIEVRIDAWNNETKEIIQTAYVRSVISQEQEPGAYSGGNLLVNTCTAVGPGPNEYGLEGMTLSLIDGPDIRIPSPGISGQTDDTGSMFFGGDPVSTLYAGTYDLKASISGVNLIVEPDMVEQMLNIPDGLLTQTTVPYDLPCQLTMSFRDQSTGQPITSGGTILLGTPWGAGTVSYPFSGGSKTMSDLWPVGPNATAGAYTVTVLANGYCPYTGPYNVNSSPWDGQFADPGTPTSGASVPPVIIDPITLTPAPAVVTVTDQNSGAPIVGAQVEVKLYKYTYNGANWDQSVASDVFATTSVLGTAAFASVTGNYGDPLGTGYSYSQPAPPLTADVSSYYQFDIDITAPTGYNAFPETTLTGAFPAGYPASLTATSSLFDLHVRAEYASGSYYSGYPRYGDTIKLTAPDGTTEIATTGIGGDSPGEVVFNMATLGFGTYKTQRETFSDGGGWTDIWSQNIPSGAYGDYHVATSW
jgi:prepilin-type N-terminal cleavage/methylation domain-containing protein